MIVGPTPANALRIALHPQGVPPRTINFAECSSHLLHRLRREARVTGDQKLRALYDELAGYPGVSTAPVAPHPQGTDILLPLRLRTPDGKGELALFSTISTFGTASDIALSELAVEAFYPANASTAMRLMRDVTPEA